MVDLRTPESGRSLGKSSADDLSRSPETGPPKQPPQQQQHQHKAHMFLSDRESRGVNCRNSVRADGAP
ncbi:unnamed protein product [Caenorhabditis auriculariae]|uniref:Uncharacterized protein n=1 Tax=Caenorhabditis auriculariae TaxID=2777116 RepID=A0A8S1HLC6_9PELO|nr:unnamed protein product [Caenorhabditis auriculariae]